MATVSTLPCIEIVTPSLPGSDNGNAHTAGRWARFLAPMAQVRITTAWSGATAAALIALHAWRSAQSIERFHLAYPGSPLAIVLTGTDLYRDIPHEAGAMQALLRASHLVVLQEEALHSLPPLAADVRVIEQSAARVVRHDKARRHFDFVAIGHLRDEKDPQVLLDAARLLPETLANDLPPRVLHIGTALQPHWQRAAEVALREIPPYRWLGGVPQRAARRWIARARALVHMSRMEGGAHVVIEAIRSQVPVLASRIDGNVGLLGRAYDGYFPPGDAQALARLMQRFAAEPAFAAKLAAQCALREPRFAPAVERAAVQTLACDLFASRIS